MGMLARVWNDHTEKYEEEFRGNLISIPSKGSFDIEGLPSNFVTMEAHDANQFLGQYTPIIRDGMDNDLKPKMLRREVINGTETKLVATTAICQRCGMKFHTDKELDSHVMANHLDDLDKKSRDEFVGTKPKNKGGRPRKNPVQTEVAS